MQTDQPGLRCDVLGPLLVRRGDVALTLGSPSQQATMAVLALHANRPIGREQLIDALWGSAVPTYAVNLVQKRVSELRNVLEQDRSPGAPSQVLRWTDRGYLLTLPEEDLDLSRHQRDLAKARADRAGGDLRTAASTLRAALALWRGPAFDGLSSPLLDAERDRLSEARITALEDRIDLELMLGADADHVPELRRLVAEHPVRDRLRGLLMIALYRAGRPAEALDAYHDARQFLSEELGIDPGVELQVLYQRILTADPDLGTLSLGTVTAERELSPRETASSRAESRVPPAELPHALPHFVGRDAELKLLDSLAPGPAVAPEMSIIVIAGTAGVGKTTLAVHWAHRIRDRFPDGQLSINLRGFDPTGATVESADAIRGFLDALSSSTQHLPVRLEAQAALFRSLIAGKRMLILLDNARDADQVRDLLPGTPGCLVIVTSRNQLGGLVATDGASIVDLDLLSTTDARSLLVRRLGSVRVAGEPQAVDQIIDACARLPLALSIAAARAVTRPNFPLSGLAAELADVRTGLDAYSGDDEASDVRAVFSWSYDRLSAPARRLFGLFGIHPSGPEVSLHAAASLAGQPLRGTSLLLAELARANLLIERRPRRFAMHDLLRAYAGELALDELSTADRSAAFVRIHDFYLYTAHRADQLLNPHRDDPISLPPPFEGTARLELRDDEQARTWFATEHFVLLATVQQAVELGHDEHAWQLTWALAHYLEYEGHWHDAAAVLATALTATRRLGDRRATTTVLNLLGRARTLLTEYDDARGLLTEALTLAAAAGDLAGEADANRNIAWVLDRRGDYDEAVGHAVAALRLYRADGRQPHGEGRALNACGWFYAQLGDIDRALEFCRDALRLQEQIGDVLGVAETHDSLGFVTLQSGDLAASVAHYARACQLYRRLGDRYNEADTRVSLGDSNLAAGDHQAARAAWEEAAEVFEQLGHAQVDRVRTRLASLDSGGQSPLPADDHPNALTRPPRTVLRRSPDG